MLRSLATNKEGKKFKQFVLCRVVVFFYFTAIYVFRLHWIFPPDPVSFSLTWGLCFSIIRIFFLLSKWLLIVTLPQNDATKKLRRQKKTGKHSRKTVEKIIRSEKIVDIWEKNGRTSGNSIQRFRLLMTMRMEIFSLFLICRVDFYCRLLHFSLSRIFGTQIERKFCINYVLIMHVSMACLFRFQIYMRLFRNFVLIWWFLARQASISDEKKRKSVGKNQQIPRKSSANIDVQHRWYHGKQQFHQNTTTDEWKENKRLIWFDAMCLVSVVFYECRQKQTLKVSSLDSSTECHNSIYSRA